MAFNINTYFEKEIDERIIQQGCNFEMERLGIDLSWKSSRIEGYTYSLLLTLNFILQEPDYLKALTVSHVEDIHSILTDNLNVDRNIRSRRVGITGTTKKQCLFSMNKITFLLLREYLRNNLSLR